MLKGGSECWESSEVEPESDLGFESWRRVAVTRWARMREGLWVTKTINEKGWGCGRSWCTWGTGHIGCKWSVGKWKLERSWRVMCAVLGEDKGLGRIEGWSLLTLEKRNCCSVRKNERGAGWRFGSFKGLLWRKWLREVGIKRLDRAIRYVGVQSTWPGTHRTCGLKDKDRKKERVRRGRGGGRRGKKCMKTYEGDIFLLFWEKVPISSQNR